jgi:hypothetical protein
MRQNRIPRGARDRGPYVARSSGSNTQVRSILQRRLRANRG